MSGKRPGELSFHKTKPRIAQIRDANGDLHTRRDAIAEVFATFYECLYDSNCGMATGQAVERGGADVSSEEVRQLLERTLKHMKHNKACADDGLVVEMLQTQHEPLLQALATIFTDILRGNTGVPETWRRTRLTILFKKGDITMPTNYRPIAIIPVMCKVFGGILLNRMKTITDALRTEEDIGFRADYSCGDLVHTLRMVSEKSIEWNETVWMASLDLEKAFDKILHSAVFEGLQKAGVDEATIQAIRLRYSDQHAYVQLEANLRSRLFSILRGVRQGDPMSPLLFTNTIREAMLPLKVKWEEEGVGTIVGSHSSGQGA